MPELQLHKSTKQECEMDCPKCNAKMNERNMRTLQGLVTYDQCSACKGFWFDTGEAEKLKDT